MFVHVMAVVGEGVARAPHFVSEQVVAYGVVSEVGQALSQYISELVPSGNVRHFDDAVAYALADDVVLDVDVLGPAVRRALLGSGDRAGVVDVSWDGLVHCDERGRECVQLV